jgi:hypothetical protein
MSSKPSFPAFWDGRRQAGSRNSGKGQEARIVNRLLSVMTADDDLHIVVQTFCGQPAQMREGSDVLANRRVEVLAFDKMPVPAAGISQDVGEGMHPSFALHGEIDVIGGIVHPTLKSGGRLEAADQESRAAAQLAQAVADNRVGAGTGVGGVLPVVRQNPSAQSLANRGEKIKTSLLMMVRITNR